MKLQAGILGIMTVVALATPGFAQASRPLSVASDSRSMDPMLIAQQPTNMPTAVQNNSVRRQKWEYLIAYHVYDNRDREVFVIGDKKISDGSKDELTNLRVGLAELGSLGYELVQIQAGRYQDYNRVSVYIFKRVFETP
jgi:Flp pilus assembly protein CpaB